MDASFVTNRIGSGSGVPGMRTMSRKLPGITVARSSSVTHGVAGAADLPRTTTLTGPRIPDGWSLSETEGPECIVGRSGQRLLVSGLRRGTFQ